MRDDPAAGPRAGAQLFTGADVAGEMGDGATHCPALPLRLPVTAATPAQGAQSALPGRDFPWPAIDMHVSASLGVHPARTAVASGTACAVWCFRAPGKALLPGPGE